MGWVSNPSPTDFGGTMNKDQEQSERMLSWFNALAKRAQQILYKPIESLTDQEKRQLGIIHE